MEGGRKASHCPLVQIQIVWYYTAWTSRYGEMVDTLPLGGSARASRFESEWRQALPGSGPNQLCSWAPYLAHETLG